jgi:hypothetical protein
VDDLPSRRSLRCWSRKQVRLMTGEMGRSFVVGYGSDGGPRFAHHRASTCPGDGGACNWDTYWSDSPNGEALIGALVGGPNAEEEYKDSRLNYIQNLVSIEYNAGGSLAAAAARLPQVAAAGLPGAAGLPSGARCRAPAALPARARELAGRAASGALGASSPPALAHGASQASPP